MLRSAALALLLAGGDTPEKTFEELKKAVTSKNWEDFHAVVAPSQRKQLEDRWEESKKRRDKNEIASIATTLGLKQEAVLKLSGRELFLRIMSKMDNLNPEMYEREFGKFKNGTLAGTRVEGDSCFLTIKVGDKQEEAELVREGGTWYFMDASERKSNERNAWASLKTCVAAQADLRSNDRDGDRIQNFWVKDVAGLYALEAGGEMIRLIEQAIAQADQTAGKGSYPSLKEARPKAGYSYASLKSYRENGKAIPYDDGKGRNLTRFGMTAYPAEYPQSGRLTYVINELNRTYSKDTRGKPPEEFPEDPEKEGWKRLD